MSGKVRRGIGVAVVVAVVVSVLAALPARAGLSPGLAGSYRATLTLPELLAAGEVKVVALGDAGTWTLTVSAGSWSLRQTAGRFGNAVERGTLTRAGDQLRLTLASADGRSHREYLGAVEVRRRGSELRLSAVKPLLSDVVPTLAAQPWRRVA